MKFPYKKFILEKPIFQNRKVILRPILPIQIEYHNKQVKYEVMVDSGADFSIFHAEIGEILGIPVKDGRKWEFGGITGGKSFAYLHKVKISVGGWTYKTIVSFSWDLPSYGLGVVGQIGFFDQFIVKFDLQKEIFELKPKT